jgi:hypothetical protein
LQQEHNLDYFCETSALLGTNVERLFTDLCKILYLKYRDDLNGDTYDALDNESSEQRTISITSANYKNIQQ